MGIEDRIWIPNKSIPRPFRCGVCGAALTQNEYERHVVSCSNQNEEELRLLSPEITHPGLFSQNDPDYSDVEWREYVKRTGKMN